MNETVFARVATPIALIVAGLLIAGAVIYTAPHAGANPPVAQPVKVDVRSVSIADDPIIGDPNAPVAMAFWSDYQCPFCSQFDTTVLPDIIKNYVDTGKMRIVFKDFQFLGPDSDEDALYARAVWHLYPEKFEVWHGAMYASQPKENTLDDTANLGHIRDVAERTGLDFGRLTADVDANKATYEARIAADRAEGTKDGITGTPSFIVGTQELTGSEPYATMASALDAALARH